MTMPEPGPAARSGQDATRALTGQAFKTVVGETVWPVLAGRAYGQETGLEHLTWGGPGQGRGNPPHRTAGAAALAAMALAHEGRHRRPRSLPATTARQWHPRAGPAGRQVAEGSGCLGRADRDGVRSALREFLRRLPHMRRAAPPPSRCSHTVVGNLHRHRSGSAGAGSGGRPLMIRPDQRRCRETPAAGQAVRAGGEAP